MRTRTVTSPSLPWLTAVLVVLGLLTGCGRPAPEGEAALESAPDPAAENLTEPSSGTDDPSLQSQPADSGQMSDGGQVTGDSAQMGDRAANEPVLEQAAPAPVIITADNLSGLVDQSPDRAGVKVTSSNPVVAVAPPVESTTSTVAAQSRIHVVQPGDTLSVIAESYGVGIEAIADANGLENVDAIKPGQELVIPAG